MKINVLFTVIAVIFGTMALQAQDQMFDKLSDNDEITSVFISKPLLSMVANMDMGDTGINIKGLVDKLERMEIYTGESESTISLIKSAGSKLSSDKTFEVLMKVKDNGENVIFYSKKTEDGYFKDLIMFVDGASECTIIRIAGRFTMEDIQGVMAKKE